MSEILAVFMGAIAGFIDSIAGGGGLITLPTLTILVGPGAHAIGSNKIVGLTGAAIALWVYSRTYKIGWRDTLTFSAAIGLGSSLGGLATPHLPQLAFKILLLLTCPLILIVVWKKDLWLQTHLGPKRADLSHRVLRILGSGLACGFYDGAWGPGGGTFMLLALIFVARLPLLPALTASKFANAVSAGSSLIAYQAQGFVHWKEGALVALGMGVGAWFGAKQASKRAAEIIRPALVVVVLLLLGRLALEHFRV